MAGIAVSGCAANPKISDLTPQQQKLAQSVKLYDGADHPEKFQRLERVSGLSCLRGTVSYTRFSQSVAREGLRLNAALLNGNAVINVTCELRGVDYETNCWRSHICFGDAVRVD